MGFLIFWFMCSVIAGISVKVYMEEKKVGDETDKGMSIVMGAIFGPLTLLVLTVIFLIDEGSKALTKKIKKKKCCRK